ncbi:MAG: hypothetical protein KBC93_12675, partial [Candidatus Microthrix sp.]|nr:hypothetical protein [Candidatus Microthrix sp.]
NHIVRLEADGGDVSGSYFVEPGGDAEQAQIFDFSGTRGENTLTVAFVGDTPPGVARSKTQNAVWTLAESANGQILRITFHGKKIPHPASWAAGQQATQYDPASPEIDFGGGGDPYNNLIVGKPGYQQPKPAALNSGGWVTVEVESHGKDTTEVCSRCYGRDRGK